ncbi:MAG: hypothetical protein ABI693_27940 [Bryobacteraceae bacterium]
MRTLISCTILTLALLGSSFAQRISRTVPISIGPTAPANCRPGGPLFFATTSPTLYYCSALDTWAPISSSGGIPDSPSITGQVTADSYTTRGSGAGLHTWKNSGDSNYVATEGFTGTRAASLTLAQPGTDPTTIRGVPSWNAPQSGKSTCAAWIMPMKTEAASSTTVSPAAAASVCLMSLPFSTPSPFAAAGAIYQYNGTGNWTAGASAISTYKLQLSTAANCGGTTIDLASNGFGTANNAAGSWRVTGYLSVLTTGTTGTVTSYIEPSMVLTGPAYQTHPTALASTTVNTTVTDYWLNLVVTTSGANPLWNQYLGILQKVN